MNVRQLRELLDELPDDLLIVVPAKTRGRGINQGHVEYIRREYPGPRLTRIGTSGPCEHPGCRGHAEYGHELWPGYLSLGATIFPVPVHTPAPEVRYSGRFTRAARAVIDRWSSDPE